jgi:hypothetical protein
LGEDEYYLTYLRDRQHATQTYKLSKDGRFKAAIVITLAMKITPIPIGTRLNLRCPSRSILQSESIMLDELFSIRQLVVVCQFGIITNLSTATFRPAVRCWASGKSITVIASNFLMVPGFGKGKISVSSTGDVLPGG